MDHSAVTRWITAGMLHFDLNISKNDFGFGKSWGLRPSSCQELEERSDGDGVVGGALWLLKRKSDRDAPVCGSCDAFWLHLK